QPAQIAEFRRALLERTASMPGVISADSADFLPFSNSFSASSFDIIGRQRNPNEPAPVVIQTRIGADYFRTMSIPIHRGRGFSTSDAQGTTPVAVIDETVVKKYFTNLDPIGQQISSPQNHVNCTIIGVAGAVKYRDLAAPPEPVIYY